MKPQKHLYLTLLLLSIFLLICKSTSVPNDPDVDRLVSWMTGSFSSEEQAQADSNFFDIRLEMIQIWQDRSDGKWLYVEQAAASSLDKPYRQRVYRLSRSSDTSFESAVFTLKNPLEFAGAWKMDDPLATITPDSLEQKDGCSIVLRKIGDEAFVGSTVEKDCPSQLRGATYATSEVTITPNEMISWDRGFDLNDQQVWGSTVGGYIFKKIKNY